MIYINSERSGMGFYRPKIKDDGEKILTLSRAVEEGMARWICVDADEVLYKIAPEGLKKYLELLKQTGYAGSLHPPEMFIDDNGKIIVGAAYIGAFELILELNRGLNNRAMYLLEKARLTGNFLDLARQVEKVYGPQTFRDIMTTSLEDASAKAQELARLRHERVQK